jgi:hypothetical protein
MTTIHRQLTTQMTQTRRSFGRHTAMWVGFLEAESAAWQALGRRVGHVAFRWVEPRSLERTMLTRVDTVLTRADRVLTSVSQSVAEKLASLDDGMVTDMPIEGYEEMTAKAIVAEIPNLSETACRALAAFEARNKQRATVLRAADNRLAA